MSSLEEARVALCQCQPVLFAAQELVPELHTFKLACKARLSEKCTFSNSRVKLDCLSSVHVQIGV